MKSILMLCLSALFVTGCAVVSVASTAVSVTADVVGLGVKGVTAAGGAVIDAVTDDDDDEKKKEEKEAEKD
jgi:hypothetical protein